MPNFDQLIPRHDTNCLKYDFHAHYGKPAGVTPLWVADMDFQVPECVTHALQQSVSHAIYGYTETKADYFGVVSEWFATEHDYHVQPEWLVKTPGIVYALGMAIQAYTQVGDGVLIHTPNYYPIPATITANNRQVVASELVYQAGDYSIDFVDFEQKLAQCKLFILCNPHNPVGRVWTTTELQEMGRLCKKHGVLVVSDEIHCDLVFAPHRHVVFSVACPDVPALICTSPSKTFNLAGLQVSNIFIAHEALREQFKAAIRASGYSQLNQLGLVAAQAAYTGGKPWLTQLKAYIQANAQLVADKLAVELPLVKVVPLEGTYLLWVDFNALNIPHEELENRLLNHVGVWLSSGLSFGEGGRGFFRFNLACPSAVLAALDFRRLLTTD